MKVENLLKFDKRIYGSTLNVSLDYFLNSQKQDALFLEKDDKEIPLEVSVYKFLNNIPIVIVEIIERKDGKTNSIIVKGANEIKNLLRWLNEDVDFEMFGQSANFANFNDEDKEYVLQRMTRISLCRVAVDNNEDIITLKDIIKSFC